MEYRITRHLRVLSIPPEAPPMYSWRLRQGIRTVGIYASQAAAQRAERMQRALPASN